jgi:myo-inositol catabolism protein IolS
MAIETVRLGADGPVVSRLGFGGCPMGGFGWGATDDAELVAAAREALDFGVTFFDTADIYGLGKSEELLGKALAGQWQRSTIATKGGLRRGAGGTTFHDSSPAYLRDALEQSLLRLGVDHVDLYQLHYWDERTPIDDIFETFESLRSEGKIGCYGVSNLDLVDAGLAEPRPGLVSVSFEYSLAHRGNHPVIVRNARALRTTVISWGSLGQGVLTGAYTADVAFGAGDRRSRPIYDNFHGEKLAENLQVVDLMTSMVPAYPTRHVAAVALRWILDTIPESVALVGIKRPEQLRANVEALGWHLTPEDLARLGGLQQKQQQNHG